VQALGHEQTREPERRSGARRAAAGVRRRQPAPRLVPRVVQERLLLLVGVAAYLWLLCLHYRLTIAPVYAHMGFEYAPRSLPVRVVGVMCGLVPAMWLPYRVARPSHMAPWVLYLLVVAPTCVLSGVYGGALSDMQLCIVPIMLTAALALAWVANRTPGTVPRPEPRGPKLFWIILGGTAAVTYVGMTATLGLPTHFLRFEDVYSTRDIVAERLTGPLGLVVTLFISLMGKGLNVLALAIGVQTRRPWLVAAALISGLWMYCVTSHKAFLLLPIASWLALLPNRRGRLPGLVLLAGGCAALVAGIAIDNPIINVLLIRRACYVPAHLTLTYYEFFSAHPFALYGDTYYARWLHLYPYDVSVADLIGSSLPGTSSAQHANANVWAAAYSNFGYIAVFVESWILGRLWRWCDSLAGREYRQFGYVLMFAYSALAWSNSALHRSLVGGGFLGAMLLLWVAPRDAPEVWARRRRGSARALARRRR
jgi:hypothetical protein